MPSLIVIGSWMEAGSRRASSSAGTPTSHTDPAVDIQEHGSSGMNDKVNLAGALATFTGHWQPRVVAQYNGNDLMVAKVQGEFVWHRHD